ncbi:hypothetical protein JW796_02915 [Candidatus Dojkabacteria bacterium]|nr:hypothetical protein [Candidatus Dojkabacteria bacterium]
MDDNINGENFDPNQWVKKLHRRLSSYFSTSEILPEIIERAHLEASEDSVTAIQNVHDYMHCQLSTSGIITEHGVKVFGGTYIKFPTSDIVIELGLPDNNFYIMYGFRAEQKGKRIDPKRYVDIVVDDLEKKLAQGNIPSLNYELFPIRETIESILKQNFGYKPGHELHLKAAELEEEAINLLDNLTDPLSLSEINLSSISIPRTTEYRTIRLFDIECYS